MDDEDYETQFYNPQLSEIAAVLYKIEEKIDQLVGFEMDKQIKKIQKDTKKLAKEESALLKADKKRDEVCDYGEKMLKGKKK